ITGDLTIQGPENELVASRIDVSGRGFPPGQGPGAGVDCGNTSGASYGGAGGADRWAPGGGTYGLLESPRGLGSGGYDKWGGGRGCVGGGGALTVDGMVLGDGAGGVNWAGGGGGAVNIECTTLRGTGMITAQGGARGTVAMAPGAGGGRIALRCE